MTQSGGKGIGAPTVLSVALVAFALALLASALPRSLKGGQAPPLVLLVLFGLFVIVGMLLVVGIAMKLGLELSRATVTTVIAFNAALIVIKFVLSPLGLYLANAHAPFIVQPLGFNITNDPAGFWFAAIGTALAYILSLWVIYERVRASAGLTTRGPVHVRRIVAIIAGLVVLFIVGSQYVILPAFLAAAAVGSFTDYLSKLGPVLPAIILMLVVAIALAIAAFQAAAADSKALKRPGLIAGLFWLCLCLILMYHMLWIVFMTALVTIWPFKTFIPNSK